MGWIAKGLKLEKDKNVFEFKNGRLKLIKSRYNKLDAKRKEIAKNIAELIDNSEDIVVTLIKGNDETIVKDKRGQNHTLKVHGGAVTTQDPANPLGVNIYINPDADFTDPELVVSADPEKTLENPVWLVLSHELGGHAYLKFVKLDPYQIYNTILYENKVRALHDLGERKEDIAHPNLLRD